MTRSATTPAWRTDGRAGPAAWLMEEVLGVKALEPGFKRAQIRPELAGLEWAKGGVATPLGVVGVDARGGHYVVTIPAGMEAEVLLPARRVKMDGVRGERRCG